jgi:hypothetical protein
VEGILLREAVLAIVWGFFLMTTFLSQSLGLFGVILDYSFVFLLAFFGNMLKRRDLFLIFAVQTLFMWVRMITLKDFIVDTVWNIQPPKTMDRSEVDFISSLYIFLIFPFHYVGSQFLAYWLGCKTVKRLKIRERVGKVING